MYSDERIINNVDYGRQNGITKTILMEKNVYKNAYILKLIYKIQHTKNNLIEICLHFLRNQNLDELFLNVSIPLRIFYYLSVSSYLPSVRRKNRFPVLK